MNSWLKMSKSFICCETSKQSVSALSLRKKIVPLKNRYLTSECSLMWKLYVLTLFSSLEQKTFVKLSNVEKTYTFAIVSGTMNWFSFCCNVSLNYPCHWPFSDCNFCLENLHFLSFLYAAQRISNLKIFGTSQTKLSNGYEILFRVKLFEQFQKESR